jgi:predicted glycosyltransferase involved in capsule biosynthesis
LKWISEDPDTEWIILNLNSKDDLHQFMIEQMRVAPPRVIYARDLSNHPWHKSVATNAAHRLARGDILVNLDCDNFIGEATQLIRAGFAPDVDVIHLWSGERGDGSCGRVAISRDAFYRLGGYDESFHPMGYQDMDILERARARGMKLLRIPSSEYLPIRNDKLESMRHCAGGISQWEELNQENRTVSRINIASRRFAANAGKNWGRLKLEIVAGGGRESPRFRGEVLSQGKI